MKKILVTILAAFMVIGATGCFFPSPSAVPPTEQPTSPPTQQEPQDANEKPTAHIDAIEPKIATVSEEIVLQGHGTDADGTVVAYRWRSSIEGPLGVNESISTSDLSIGEHEILFKVQDNNGAWSDEVSDDLLVRPKVEVPLTIEAFSADLNYIHVGDNVTLSWEVAGADEVVIEPGIGVVDASGSLEVSPEETTEYILTATQGTQTKHNILEITVIEPSIDSVILTAVQSETSSIFGDAPPAVWPPGMGMSVGDFSTDIPVQGFVTFDISDIPNDAVILETEVNFSSYSTGGTPFDDLGCLRVYPQNFGTLEREDFFTGSPTGAILKYCSESAITPHSSESFRDAIQSAVGHDRFQVRFQFNELDTDHNGDQDYIHWDHDELLIYIEYESYQ